MVSINQYQRVKAWIDDNFDLIIEGDTPFDFGNPVVQQAADDYLAEKLVDLGYPPDVIENVRDLPPVEFPRNEEPTAVAQESKSIFGKIYDSLKNAFSSFSKKLRSFFGF